MLDKSEGGPRTLEKFTPPMRRYDWLGLLLSLTAHTSQRNQLWKARVQRFKSMLR